MHQAGLDHNHLRGERQGVGWCIRSRLGFQAHAPPSDGLVTDPLHLILVLRSPGLAGRAFKTAH
jgi:hypothetical protein